jgi:hypothetical protein
LRAIKRRNSAPILARYRPLNEDALRQQTTEDRRAQASGRRRLQTRIDPKNREVWERLQRAGTERAKVLRQDPGYAEARVAQMVAARGSRVVVPCAVCGTPMELPGWQVRRSRQHTCSEPCQQELHRRLLAERGYLSSSEIREKAGATRRRTLKARPEYGREVGAKISQAKRRRDRQVIEELRKLPVTAWEAVPEPGRSMVRRYYGLDGGQAVTLAELMTAFRLQHRDARRMLVEATSRLFEPELAARG